MIEITTVRKRVIQNHYDITTLFYRLLWGPHIHHGYWEGSESPTRAQLQLTERLAHIAEIQPGSKVYDIGCGMGGSSQWLARQLGCQVTGVTLSPLQRQWASWSAAWHRTKPRPHFLRCDAEQLEVPPASLDVVWSIECTEHLFDKPAFFRNASTWLRPGGRMALCAWLHGQSPLSAAQVAQVEQVCHGMFCPSLGSQEDYVAWLQAAGLRVLHQPLWTRQVERTWEICQRRVSRTGARWLARWLGKQHILFLDHFDAILAAYRSGAMEYGCFVAEKLP